MNKPGDVIGEWTLERYVAGCRAKPRRDATWVCRCSCGEKREVQANNLHSGRSTSCGHDLAERMSKGMRRYHDRREQQQAPVATTPAANPWAILGRYKAAARLPVSRRA